MTQPSLKVADLYCGAGGLSAGFAAAIDPISNHNKFEICYGVDYDADAIKAFRHYHFPNATPEELLLRAPHADIEAVTAEDIRNAVTPGEVDILIGGPNCQGVSAAGLRNPKDKRNKMLSRFIELVEELRPKWFVMENVPGLTHSNNRALLAAIFEAFEAIEGYQVSGDILLAADFGVPQLRYRLFVIGTNTGAPIRFPEPTHQPIPTYKKPRKLPSFDKPYYVTVHDAIGDLVETEPVALDGKSSNAETQIPNHVYAELSLLNCERIAALAPGQDWRDMPVRLLPERYFATRASDQKGAYGRLMWDWPAYTLTNAAYNVTAGPFTHPEKNRALTVREAARLQSFCDSHTFYGTALSQYKQVGNAVPPKLARAVADAIFFCHYFPTEAKDWGYSGRLNSKIIKEAQQVKSKFPTLTPRQVYAGLINTSKKTPRLKDIKKQSKLILDVWNQEPRPVEDPHPTDTILLRELAKQPTNYRAAKRARAIVQFMDGKPKSEILDEANTADLNVGKWVNDYYALGLDGWRAYHTSVARLADDNEALTNLLEANVKKVRQITLKPQHHGSTNGLKRLHMNSYLLELRDRLGDRSVTQLIAEVEEALGYSIGTVYVGDLLAIHDSIIPNKKLHDNVPPS